MIKWIIKHRDCETFNFDIFSAFLLQREIPTIYLALIGICQDHRFLENTKFCGIPSIPFQRTRTEDTSTTPFYKDNASRIRKKWKWQSCEEYGIILFILFQIRINYKQSVSSTKPRLKLYFPSLNAQEWSIFRSVLLSLR